MSAAAATLPAGFEALEPFVAMWDLTTAEARAKRRLIAAEAERAAFYDTGWPLLAAALEHLDGKPISTFDASEARLMNLMLSLAHVSLSIEVQGADEPKHAVGAQRLTIVRTPAAT